MTLQQLRDRLRALVDEAKALEVKLDAGDELTDEEQKRFDAIGGEIDECEHEVRKAEKLDGLRRTTRRLDSKPLDDHRSEEEPKPEARADPWGGAWTPEDAGLFFRSVYQSSVDRRVAPAIEERAPSGMGNLIDSEGGFLVPTTIAAEILRNTFGEGSVAARCRQIPITVGNSTSWNAIDEDSRASGKRYGGITTAWLGEGATITASKTSIRRVSLKVQKIAALVHVTDENLEDAAQTQTLISDLVPLALRFAIDEEIFNGDGNGRPEGIVGGPATVSVSKETDQAAATVLYENIIKMYSRMFAPSRQNAVWFINQDIEPQLFSMSLAVGTAGVPVYLPANGLAGAPFATLMGRPVVPIEHAATLGTVGDIVFADMSQYLLAVKGGVRTAQSMHVKFTTDEQSFRFIMRVDGKSWWKSALTPAKGSNTLSPFITLATRA